MREIKFRIWTKKVQAFTSNFYHRNDKRYSLNEILDNFSNDDEHILMQYTGQKDKNGKEIWEGDILGPPINDNISLDEGYRGEFCRGEVYWNSRSSAFEINMRNHLESWIDGLGGIGRYEEVIGNIYENPELRVIKDE